MYDWIKLMLTEGVVGKVLEENVIFAHFIVIIQSSRGFKWVTSHSFCNAVFYCKSCFLVGKLQVLKYIPNLLAQLHHKWKFLQPKTFDIYSDQTQPDLIWLADAHCWVNMLIVRFTIGTKPKTNCHKIDITAYNILSQFQHDTCFLALVQWMSNE